MTRLFDHAAVLVVLALGVGSWLLAGCDPGEPQAEQRGIADPDAGAGAKSEPAAAGSPAKDAPSDGEEQLGVDQPIVAKSERELVLQEGKDAAGAAKGGSSSPAGSGVAEGLSFSRKRHDFGKVKGFRHLYHDFPFEVVGEKPVVIQKCATSCRCTPLRILVEGKEYRLGDPIPPGRRGHLRIRYDTFDISGLHGSAIDVVTSLGTQRLLLTVDAIPEFVLEPKKAEMGQIMVGRAGTTDIEVSSAIFDRFEIVDWGVPEASSPPPPRGAELGEEQYERMLEDHQRAALLKIGPKPEEVSVRLRHLAPAKVVLSLSFRPREKRGNTARTLRFITDRKASFKINVSGLVVPPVYLEPAPRTFLGAMKQGTSRTWEFTLVDSDPDHIVRIEDVRIRSAFGEHFGIETASLPPKDGVWRTVIKLKVKDTIPLGKWQGTLNVFTNHPEHSVLSCEFQGFTHNE